MVVDDHPGFRLQARLMLEDAGYVVVGEASDAATAISAARALLPEVILLDIGLPDRDGFYVSEVLAAEMAAPVVVLISGRWAGDYGSRVSACGARCFLAKADLESDALARILADEADL